ncbi:MAG: right-handed parallel beta-helix repeat-containing protein, partial [Paludibacteraceae bacterium]|nr:right-handed parallel beta-helix repeat-containing protein [Paludibacteraceae bacterium]
MILLDCFLKSDRIAAIRKAFLTLIIVLLPLTANSFVRKFVVTNTLFVEQPVGQPPYVVSGSLAAAVDSVNKYYADSCVIEFNLKPTDTIRVTSYYNKLISNETFVCIDGGNDKICIKNINTNFGLKEAKHVIVKNIDFSGSTRCGLYVEDSQIDTISNCVFNQISSEGGGGIYAVNESSLDFIGYCNFSGDVSDAIVFTNKVKANIINCYFENCRKGVVASEEVYVAECTFLKCRNAFYEFGGYAKHCIIDSCSYGLYSLSSYSIFDGCYFNYCTQCG